MKYVLVVLCSLLFVSSVGEAGVIELRERVTVTSGNVVRLGDVASIHDPEASRAVTLRELPLGPAPAAGRSWTVTYDDVRQKLQSRGENLAAIEFRGQRQVVVTAAVIKPEPAIKPAAVTITTEPPVRPQPKVNPEVQQRRAETLLVTVLQRSFKPAEAGIAVDFQCQLDPLEAARVAECRPSDVHFVAAALRGDMPTPMTAWWIDRATQERHEIPVTVTMTQRPQRLAVRHAVPKGFLLRPEDLMWVDAAKEDAGMTLLGDAIGKETTRNLRAGHLLSSTDVANVPLMRTNDIVTVIVRRPGISVRREFKALSSAAMNEAVSLVALNDPRLRIQATVTGYREATLSDVPVESGGNDGIRLEERPASPPSRGWSVR